MVAGSLELPLGATKNLAAEAIDGYHQEELLQKPQSLLAQQVNTAVKTEEASESSIYLNKGVQTSDQVNSIDQMQIGSKSTCKLAALPAHVSFCTILG